MTNNAQPTGSPLTTLIRLMGAILSRGFIGAIHKPAAARQFWSRLARAALAPSAVDTETLRLPAARLETFVPNPDAIPVSLVDYRYEHGDMPLHEIVALCRLVRHWQPQVIFEIGTFNGGTTLQLAANSAARIYTLDLPPDAAKPVWDEMLDVYPQQTGARFRNSPYAARITQLWGDSRTFDYRPYEGQCDLVFVDACHHYEFVKSDSMHALRLVRPGGCIVWHDYAPEVPGVVQALHELHTTLPLRHLVDTCLVIAEIARIPTPAPTPTDPISAHSNV